MTGGWSGNQADRISTTHKNKLEVGRGSVLSKPIPSDMLPPSFTALSSTDNWGPGAQIHEPMGTFFVQTTTFWVKMSAFSSCLPSPKQV